MNRRASLLAIVTSFLCLVLPSCVWTYQYSPFVGERIKILEPDKVAIHKRPSFDSETFRLEKQEDFVVERLVCVNEQFSCNYWLIEKKPFGRSSLFFKVKFDSGEEGYINFDYFYSSKKYLQNARIVEIVNQVEVAAGYNSVWSAALDTLDEYGYVVRQMSKEDGYISTDKKDVGDSRDKIAIRFFRKDDRVTVKVTPYFERRERFVHVDKSFDYYWRETSSTGVLEQKIINGILSKVKITQP